MSSESAPKTSRAELSSVIGADLVPQTTELSTFPAPGLRISYGPLAGLYAWRFVITPSTHDADSRSSNNFNLKRRSRSATTKCARAIIANFILDIEAPHSSIPPEVLRALGWPTSSSHATAAAVTLTVQGRQTKFVVGEEGEAGRLNGEWMKQGGLAVNLDDDESLDAPVLYVADEDQQQQPTTTPRPNLRRKIKQWISISTLLPSRPKSPSSSSDDDDSAPETTPPQRDHGYAPWIYSNFSSSSSSWNSNNPTNNTNIPLWGHHNRRYAGYGHGVQRLANSSSSIGDCSNVQTPPPSPPVYQHSPAMATNDIRLRSTSTPPPPPPPSPHPHPHSLHIPTNDTTLQPTSIPNRLHSPPPYRPPSIIRSPITTTTLRPPPPDTQPSIPTLPRTRLQLHPSSSPSPTTTTTTPSPRYQTLPPPLALEDVPLLPPPFTTGIHHPHLVDPHPHPEDEDELGEEYLYTSHSEVCPPYSPHPLIQNHSQQIVSFLNSQS